MGEEYAVMFEWFNEHGYEADIEELRNEHDIEIVDFEAYLTKNGWTE